MDTHYLDLIDTKYLIFTDMSAHTHYIVFDPYMHLIFVPYGHPLFEPYRHPISVPYRHPILGLYSQLLFGPYRHPTTGIIARYLRIDIGSR